MTIPRKWSDAEPLERVAQLVPRPSSEDPKLGAPRPPSQQRLRQQPPLAGHVPVAVLAPIEPLILALNVFVCHTPAEQADPGGGEFPVVVVTRTVLPAMNLSAGNALASKIPDRFDGRPVEGFTHVHQDAVHIENHKFDCRFYHSFSIASTSRRVCSRVPAVMRT